MLISPSSILCLCYESDYAVELCVSGMGGGFESVHVGLCVGVSSYSLAGDDHFTDC